MKILILPCGSCLSALCVNEATNETATGVIGLAKGDTAVIELSFDILSLEALFLVPRQDSPAFDSVGGSQD